MEGETYFVEVWKNVNGAVHTTRPYIIKYKQHTLNETVMWGHKTIYVWNIKFKK